MSRIFYFPELISVFRSCHPKPKPFVAVGLIDTIFVRKDEHIGPILRGRLYRPPAIFIGLGHGFTIALIASTTALALIGPAYSEVLYVLEPSESVLRRLV